MTGPEDLQAADSPLVDSLRPSPNHGSRASGRAPDALVLHYTGMSDGAAATGWLCNPASGVSCHYVVEEDGRILQLVAEARRAWHAGQSSWAGESDLNSASIGIEIVNPGHTGGLPPFPAPQIDAVVALCRDIVGRHAIAPARVLAHSDIAPNRKEDPGELFPWRRLHEAGLVLWVPPREPSPDVGLGPGDDGPAVLALQAALATFGYGLPVTGCFDAATAAVVRAFQRRFRPARIDGRADASTLETLAALLTLSGLTPQPA